MATKSGICTRAIPISIKYKVAFALMMPTMLYSFSASGKKKEEKYSYRGMNSAPIIILLAKLIIYSVYANSRKAGPLNNQTAKTLKIQTKWRKQPGALETHTQHSRGLLLLIAAKSASIDMLNRLASLITGRVNVAHADPWGEAVQRPIVWVSYQDLLLPLCAKRYYCVLQQWIWRVFHICFAWLGQTDSVDIKP